MSFFICCLKLVFNLILSGLSNEWIHWQINLTIETKNFKERSRRLPDKNLGCKFYIFIFQRLASEKASTFMNSTLNISDFGLNVLLRRIYRSIAYT